SLQSCKMRAFGRRDAIGLVIGTAVEGAFDQKDAQQNAFVWNMRDQQVARRALRARIELPWGRDIGRVFLEWLREEIELRKRGADGDRTVVDLLRRCGFDHRGQKGGLCVIEPIHSGELPACSGA